MENVPLWQHFVFSAIATGGFAVFFNVRGKVLIYDCIIGGIGWMIYLFGYHNFQNPFIYSFISAGFISLSAEYLARKLREPAIVIVIPGILPLIPGLGLYNTMYNIIGKNYVEAATVGSRAFITSVGIALGILVMSSLSKLFNVYQLKKAFTNNDVFKYEAWVNFGKNRTRNRFILNRKEMNDSLKSLNIDVEARERENIEKTERSKTEDYVVDHSSTVMPESQYDILFNTHSDENYDNNYIEDDLNNTTENEVNSLENEHDLYAHISDDDIITKNISGYSDIYLNNEVDDISDNDDNVLENNLKDTKNLNHDIKDSSLNDSSGDNMNKSIHEDILKATNIVLENKTSDQIKVVLEKDSNNIKIIIDSNQS